MFGDIMMLRMNVKDRLSRMTSFLYWLRIGISAVLALALTYIILSSFDLPNSVKYPLMITLCAITSVISGLRPGLFLRIICILVFFIGVCLIILAKYIEVIEVLGWDPGLLGAGASIVAVSLAVYTLLVQREGKEEIVNLDGSEKKIHGLKKGYVWLDEARKYRCEYCKNSGRSHYCKTLGGIERHIASKHV